MNKLKLATVWLDGCSGCHMSLLDLDEELLAVAARADLVYGPLVDAPEFPDGVDITLVEGAVSSQDDLKKLRQIRSRSRMLVALGDCAVTGNVAAMRNGMPPAKMLAGIYIQNVDTAPQAPSAEVPVLLSQARPVHDFVPVDFHLPGCPPSAPAILAVLTDLLEGRKPKPAVKFG